MRPAILIVHFNWFSLSPSASVSVEERFADSYVPIRGEERGMAVH